MTFQQAMDILDEFDADDLAQLSREQILYIIGGLNKSQIRKFMFAKNLKIFGGINGYAENFLSTGTVTRLKAMKNGTDKISSVEGALHTLRKMLTYDELTANNRAEIDEAILELTNETAPAAGGRRKSKHTYRARKYRPSARSS